MKEISNREIAEVLDEIGEYLAMEDVPFKPRAFEKAAETVAALNEEIMSVYKQGGRKALDAIPGVGVSIGEAIEELLKTGHVKRHEALKKKIPVHLTELRAIEGLGPKSIKKLYERLKIKTVADLERAARAGKIRKLEGFGEKAETNILKGVEFLKKSGGRFTLGVAMPIARMIEERIGKFKGVEKAMAAGSVRRRKETIGDVDVLVIADHPKPIMDYFVSMPEVARVFAHGETKSAVKLNIGLDVDVRVVPRESYGTALNYFTGSKDHNIALRQLAIGKGYKLNEYGLFRGAKRVAGKNEAELYKALGMDYIPPELREMTGEVEAAKAYKLPKLLEYDELQGDLQVQTDWTDGAASIEEMAKAAMKLGRKYIAVTDHTKRLAMTHGLDDKRILKQMAEIDRLNKKFAGKIKILKGTECDILKNGSMDLSDSTLSRLDVVGASVHSLFNLSKKEQTERIIRAIKNPNVDIIFHPTGRIIQKRAAYEVDIDALIKAAKATKTVLEIDAYPDRLDLKDEHIRKCVEAGVKMSIDSDSHSPQHLSFLEFGIAQARRGWATKEDIVNAWSLDKMLKLLKRG